MAPERVERRLAAILATDVAGYSQLMGADEQPEVLHVLPAGGRRLVQRVDGYRATIVAGTPVSENGSDTGARPGRLVRAAQMPARLDEITEAATTAIAARCGGGPIESALSALLFTAERPMG